MPPARNPSSLASSDNRMLGVSMIGRYFFRSSGPVAVGVLELVILGKTKQWKTIRRKSRGSAPQFANHAGIIEYRVPHQVGQKDLQQRSSVAEFIAARG